MNKICLLFIILAWQPLIYAAELSMALKPLKLRIENMMPKEGSKEFVDLYLSSNSSNSEKYASNWYRVLENTALQVQFKSNGYSFRADGTNNLLVYVNKEYAGFIQIDLKRELPLIKDVFVEEQFRKRGIGTMLVAIVCDMADRNGLHLAWSLATSTRFKIARKFGFLMNEKLSDHKYWSFTGDEMVAWEHFLDYWCKRYQCHYVYLTRIPIKT